MLLKKVFIFFIFLFSFFVINIDESLAIPNKISYVIMDYNNGMILEANRENIRMYPASLTKLMTLYILFECIKEKKIKITDRFKVSRTAANMPSSKLWLIPNTYISVKTLINAMIIKSANDAAYVVAENIGGTEANFVKMMNQTARDLGMKNTNFVNPNGLTAPNEYSTSLDMAILARNIISKFNDYYYLFAQKSFSWRNYSYMATDHLIGYNNIDGLKTGYTYAAGFNLITSSNINGVRVIAVTMGHPSSTERDNFMKHLINRGIIVAQNLRFTNIAYKDPPKEMVETGSLKVNNNPNIRELITYNTQESNNINSANADKNLNKENIIPVNYTTNLNNKYLTSYYLQLGVFSNIHSANKIMKKAIKIDYSLKKSTTIIDSIKNSNNKKLYRVRFYGLSQKHSYTSCKILKKNKVACFIGNN